VASAPRVCGDPRASYTGTSYTQCRRYVGYILCSGQETVKGDIAYPRLTKPAGFFVMLIYGPHPVYMDPILVGF
jgi:hypothetical protein